MDMFIGFEPLKTSPMQKKTSNDVFFALEEPNGLDAIKN